MKSMMAASMHKAGSSILDLILLDFANAKGYEIDRIARQVPTSSLSEPELMIGYQDKMKVENTYYGMARGMYVSEMPILNKLKLVVQVRDPRDCITSAYFSFKTSHRAPDDPEKRKQFLERRERLNNMEIDQFAKRQALPYKNRLNVLQDMLKSHDDILLLKYEDMVGETEKWLQDISDFVEQPLSEELIKSLGNKIDFSVKSEDASKHKRQVTPGDHKRKLKPETISEISDVLKPELSYFGYAD